MKLGCLWVLAAAVSACLGGCIFKGSTVEQPFATQDRFEKGLVIVLPGIEGRSTFNEGICNGLAEGGVQCAIELYDWTSDWGPLYNQRAWGHNHRQAHAIADRVLRYHQAFPGKPVILVGQSGGGGVAIWTAESLAGEDHLEGIILLAASLSPDYDLDLALRTTNRGVVSFYSSRDYMLWGTNITGTMDGEHTSSAGRTGFAVPNYPAASYRKLYQIPWQHDMSKTGNYGLHLTSGSEEFVARYVAPLVLSSTWSDKLVTQTISAANNQPAPPSAATAAPGAASASGAMSTNRSATVGAKRVSPPAGASSGAAAVSPSAAGAAPVIGAAPTTPPDTVAIPVPRRPPSSPLVLVTPTSRPADAPAAPAPKPVATSRPSTQPAPVRLSPPPRPPTSAEKFDFPLPQ